MLFESLQEDMFLNIAAIDTGNEVKTLYLLSLRCRIPYQLCTVKMLCSFLSRICNLT